MKHRYLHIVMIVLLGLMMSACRDMFYREVDFKVEGEKEQLVLISRLRVYASVYTAVRHTFVLDPSAPVTSDGKVGDATVAFRINSGAWTPMLPTSDTAYYWAAIMGSSPFLQPLDTVEITASHPVYGSVSSRQIMPDTVGASVTVEAIDSLRGWVRMTLHIDPYHGSSNDWIGIVVHDGEMVLTNKKSGATSYMPIELLYSTNALLSQAANMSIDGYYGAMMSSRAGGSTLYYPLFIPVSAIGEGLELSLFLDARVTDRYNDLSNFSLALSNDVSLGVYAMTHEAYRQALFARNYSGVYLPSPSGIPGSSYNYMDAVLMALSSALGRQEAISPYTNVNGGLGYFTGLSFQTIPISITHD